MNDFYFVHKNPGIFVFEILWGEMRHLRGEAGHDVPSLHMSNITFCANSPHAFQIYNTFTYSVVTIIHRGGARSLIFLN